MDWKTNAIFLNERWQLKRSHTVFWIYVMKQFFFSSEPFNKRKREVLHRRVIFSETESENALRSSPRWRSRHVLPCQGSVNDLFDSREKSDEDEGEVIIADWRRMSRGPVSSRYKMTRSLRVEPIADGWKSKLQQGELIKNKLNRRPISFWNRQVGRNKIILNSRYSGRDGSGYS